MSTEEDVDVQITENERALVAFINWHDTRYPEPDQSASYHWKVEWKERRRERFQTWMAAWQARLGPPVTVTVDPAITVSVGLNFDFAAHLQRQAEWSLKTFGPDARHKGVIDHIRKELREIENDPTDGEEWIDVVILALDGARRSAKLRPEEIISVLVAKQAKNEGRTWPDWRTADPSKAIEHIDHNRQVSGKSVNITDRGGGKSSGLLEAVQAMEAESHPDMWAVCNRCKNTTLRCSCEAEARPVEPGMSGFRCS